MDRDGDELQTRQGWRRPTGWPDAPSVTQSCGSPVSFSWARISPPGHLDEWRFAYALPASIARISSSHSPVSMPWARAAAVAGMFGETSAGVIVPLIVPDCG